MNVRLLPGHLLVVKDLPETASPSGILYPDAEHVSASQGYVLLHEPGGEIDEILEHKRIIFAKWSDRPFPAPPGLIRSATLVLVRESGVLAVFEEGTKS